VSPPTLELSDIDKVLFEIRNVPEEREIRNDEIQIKTKSYEELRRRTKIRQRVKVRW
jgi:hypothetical protein